MNARIALAVPAMAALVAASASAETAGTMFRGDAAHTGVYDSAAPTLKTVKWRFQTKGKIFSSPVVYDGVVYFGSTDRRLYAVRAADGSEIWHVTTKGAVNSTPAVLGGIVIFSSVDGNVYAVNAADGAERWRFRTNGERRFTAPGIHGIQPRNEMMPDPFDVFLSSSAVWNGTVYVGSGDHNVYALDARSGALRWSRDEHGSWVIASPAISNGTVFYTTSDERKFFGIDASTGAVRFAVGYGAFAYSSPSIAGGVAYYGAFDGRLYGVDVTSGKIVAQFSTDGATRDLAAHLDQDGNLDLATFYKDSTLDGTIVGLDAIYQLGSIAGSPAIANATLYIGSTEGTLYAIA